MVPYSFLKNIYIYGCAISIVTSTDFYNCGSNYYFNGLSGEIKFPNFGSQYSNNVECIWLINVGPNILKVDFTKIDMECGYDYVAFYDDPNYQNQISKYCSNDYVSTVRDSGVLYIKVVTDGSNVRSGFKLTWNSVAKASCYNKNCYSSDYCNVVSGSAVCSCPNSYYLQSDNRTCISFPTLCSQNNCYSSYYCKPVSNNVKCSCPNGLYLDDDQSTCIDFITVCKRKKCYSSNYCKEVSGNATCTLCPYGYYLQSGACLTSIQLCYKKNCFSSSYCNVLSGNAVCSCPNGYYLQPDSRTCIDLPTLCSQKNRYSSYSCQIVSNKVKCSCPNGLYFDLDKSTCTGTCSSLSVSGKEKCSCPNGYYLESDGITCSISPCVKSSCHSSSYCRVVSDGAVCSCHEGYFFRQDGICYSYVNGTEYGKTFNAQLLGSSIVLIAFGMIFCLFLFAFFTICCKGRKSKLEPVTVQFYAETQGAVIQGLTQNQINHADLQLGLNNMAHSNTQLPSNQTGLDNTAPFDVAPPPYEPISQSISVSVILSNESPPDYSN